MTTYGSFWNPQLVTVFFTLWQRYSDLQTKKLWPKSDTQIPHTVQTKICTQQSFSPCCAIDPVRAANCMMHSRLRDARQTVLLIRFPITLTGFPVVITLRDTKMNLFSCYLMTQHTPRLDLIWNTSSLHNFGRRFSICTGLNSGSSIWQ